MFNRLKHLSWKHCLWFFTFCLKNLTTNEAKLWPLFETTGSALYSAQASFARNCACFGYALRASDARIEFLLYYIRLHSQWVGIHVMAQNCIKTPQFFSSYFFRHLCWLYPSPDSHAVWDNCEWAIWEGEKHLQWLHWEQGCCIVRLRRHLDYCTSPQQKSR